jgi:hypothetical protein
MAGRKKRGQQRLILNVLCVAMSRGRTRHDYLRGACQPEAIAITYED